MYEEERNAAGLAARLLGTQPGNVGFMAHASDGLNLLANAIDWKEGDEVVISDLEFPSNVVPWLHAQRRGVRVRVLRSEHGIVPLETFTSALTDRTRVVSVSHVSYKTGTRAQYLSELAAAAHERGAIICVDATQSLGRLTVPLEGVDFLVCSSYKWLLGIHGVGIVYIAPELQARLQAAAAGWYSIKDVFAPDRFERFSFRDGAASIQAGMPNFGSLFVLSDSLKYLLEVGVETIDSQQRGLVSRLRDGIEQLGWSLLTPASPEYASGIVSFACADTERVAATLRSERIVVWSGDGRVRASVHLYNDDSDIEQLLDVLARIGITQ